MPNRIWQAEEEKWEKRRLRAEKVLSHIRELRRLEAEEEAEEEPTKPAGRAIEMAGQVPTPVDPTPAPVPPLTIQPIQRPQPTKKTARDVIPELLEGGPMTMKALAEAAGRSQQAIANALAVLEAVGVVKEEPSSIPGFRLQYRLATEEERAAWPLVPTSPTEGDPET